MNATRNNPPKPNLKYGSDVPFGAMDPKERMQRLDAEGLAAAIMYPTIGLLWETECDDADLTQAKTRAYNRWIVDWCSDSGGAFDSGRPPVAWLIPAPPPRNWNARSKPDARADGSSNSR